MRALKFVSVLVILATLLSACATAKKDEVKVAMLFPMTGDVSTFGISSKQGVEMALEEWNA